MTGKGEKLTEGERGVLGDLFGLLLHQALAEGSVLMAQIADEGSPEQEHWIGVAGRALPLATDYLEEVRERRSAIEEPVVREQPMGAEQRELLQLQLEHLEAQAADIRQRLSE